MRNAKQLTATKIRQSENDMAWMVRHCSPLLYIHTAAYARWCGYQSDTIGERDRCASMDISGIRFQVHHRQNHGGLND